MSEQRESSGGSGPLSPEEMGDLLRRPILARLATIQPDGWPYLVPVWQEWDGEALWLVARGRAEFVGFIRDEPKVCVSLVLDGEVTTRVMLQGMAEIVEGPVDGQGGSARWVAVSRHMAQRYIGERGPEYIQSTMDRPRCLIKITPVRITSWKGGEWHPRYLAS